MLLFKKRFLPAIRTGQKTQTIRLWKHRRMRAGQRSYVPGVGAILVEAVEPISLDDLTDADAELDGFSSLAALRQELADLYLAQAAEGQQFYRVRFSLAPRETSAEPLR
jgi:hypothetical protein